MEYAIGLALGLVIYAFAWRVGLAGDRAFFPTVLIVIASYYLLFAIQDGAARTLLVELAAMLLFTALAVVGYRRNLWWVALGLLAHGVFDFTRAGHIANTGVPLWWPGFCLTIDIALAALMAAQLWRAKATSLRRRRAG